MAENKILQTTTLVFWRIPLNLETCPTSSTATNPEKATFALAFFGAMATAEATAAKPETCKVSRD